MGNYIARRLMQLVPVVFILTVIAFGVTMLLPGDPALAILGVQGAGDQEAYQALRNELGLNRPLPLQYLTWLGNVVTGDFGESAFNHQPVLDALGQRLPVTLELGLLSMALSIVISVPLGMLAAVRANSLTDLMVSIVSFAGLAMPSFWLAILAIYLFTDRLGWLPASGYVPFTQDPVANLQHILLPVVILGAEATAGLVRQVRAAMLEVLGQDYVRTGRAKGLHEVRVIGEHAFRNALIPVVTLIGLRVARLLGGTVVIENVFALPGIGRLAVDSIFNRDFPVLQAIVLMMAVAVLLFNLLVDLLYGILDPRVRYT